MMKNTAAFKVLAAAGVVSALLAGTAFAGTWNQKGGEWTYVDDRGNAVTDGWIYDNGSWYFFQPNASGIGVMATGWVKNDGKWYFLDNSSRDTSGSLVTGWASIDGDWYYLDPSDGGAMKASGEKDGYSISADGKAGSPSSSGSGVSKIIYVYEDGTTSESTVTASGDDDDFDSFTNGSGSRRRTSRKSTSSASGSGVGPGSALGSYYQFDTGMPTAEKENYKGTDDTPSNYEGSEYRAYADLWDGDETGGSKADYIKNNTSSSAYSAYQNAAKTPQKKVVNDDGSYYLYNTKTSSYDYYSKDGELEDDSEDDYEDEDEDEDDEDEDDE